MRIVYQLEDRRRIADGYAGSVVGTFTDREVALAEFRKYLDVNPAYYGARSGHQLLLLELTR